MKKIKTILATVLIIVISFTVQSCSSDSEITTENEDLHITFTLNGEEIDIQGNGRVDSVLTLDTNYDPAGPLSISGNNGLESTSLDYVSISLLMPDYTVSSGDFNFSGTPFESGDYECSLNVNQESFQLLTTGNITITSNANGTIEGTFTGTQVDNGTTTLTITNGSFRAVYDTN